MKVLLIETLGDGGIAHYTYNLVKALKKRNCDIRLGTTYTYELKQEIKSIKAYLIFFRFAFILMKYFPTISKETKFPTLIRRLLKMIEYPLNAIELLYIAKKERIGIAHFQVVHLVDLFVVALFKIAGIRTVFTVHNVMPVHKKINSIQKFLYSKFYRFCDAFIIHSEVSKTDFRSLFNIKEDKITVIPHGNYSFFVPEKSIEKSDAKRKLGIRESSKTILFFGAIRPNKGLEDLISAMPSVIKSIKNPLLMIVGEPFQDYKKYERQIISLKIRDNVFEKLEYVPNSDIPIYFYAADVVALPYHEISQSGVLHIAYAFGNAIISTAVGGLQESIKNGKNGFLVPVNSPKKLAEKIVEILSNERIAEQMGKHSKQLAETKYSWESIAEKTKVVYQSFVK